MPSSRGFYLCFGVLTIGVVAAQPLRPIMVRGGSMAPTYPNGGVFWTTPVDRPLERGDVVVADTPEGRVIKRVVLVAGDRRVQWESYGVWGDLLTSSLPHSRAGRRRVRALVVPKGTVYLLGDNLDISIDSRDFGPVPVAWIHRLVIDQRPPDTRSGVEQSGPRDWIAMGTDRRLDPSG